MNRLIRRAAVAAFLSGTAVAVSVAMTPAYAAQQPARPTVGRAVGTPLVAGQKAFQANDFATALAEGQKADAVAEKTPYEQYQVAKLLAMAHLRLNDLPSATAQFNRAIDTGAQPEEDKAANYETAMLLNYNAKDYAKAIAYGTEKAKIAPLDERGELVMTQSYYFSDNFQGTEQYAKQAVAAAKAAGRKPQVGVLQMLLNAQIKQNNQAGAGETAVELALVEPSAENWARAIDVAFPTNGTDHQLLNLYRLKRLTKSMNQNDYLAAATTALKTGLGREGKRFLDEGIAAGVITQAAAGDTFNQANTIAQREAASLAEFERAAAADPKGETDVKLGETLWIYDRAAEGEAALRRGIQKGGIADLADAQLTLGIVLLSQGKKDEALQLFQQAGGSANLAPIARIWSMYASNS
jgi:hypothetical protein